ncbi:MAG TPA: XRE family transcriptional regulator [Clostridiales bacterium]|nr:XRE family transcriptional regulator [Clostridiales bacterium]
MPTFPERLKELRKAKGFTQKSMAEYLGMVEQAYQMYEYGKREPNHETTIKIADHLDVSLDYLMGRTNYWPDANGNMIIKTPPDEPAAGNGAKP